VRLSTSATPRSKSSVQPDARAERKRKLCNLPRSTDPEAHIVRGAVRVKASPTGMILPCDGPRVPTDYFVNGASVQQQSHDLLRICAVGCSTIDRRKATVA
jgi:hypothetical protein